MMRTLPCDGKAASLTRLEMTAASDIDSLPQQRKIKIERRAFMRSAFYTNLASVLLDNSIGHRQAQPGAAPLAILGGSLGGEERIVNSLNMLLSNAHAGVGNHHVNPVAV